MKLIEDASDRDADIYTDEADMDDTDDLYGDSLSPSQPMVASSFGKAINKNIGACVKKTKVSLLTLCLLITSIVVFIQFHQPIKSVLYGMKWLFKHQYL